ILSLIHSCHILGKAFPGDVVLDTKDSSLVVCFGEMLIDFVPTTNGLSLADAPAFKKAAGGAPANVAVGIARLGGSSAFIGKVGEDEFGYMLADILKKNNVNNEGMRFDPGARTALAFVTLRSDGEREFMFYRNPSADMLLQEAELDLDLIRKAKILHYGSISLITEPCKSAHIAAAKAAKEADVVLSYDPNLRLPLWPSAKSAREGILSIWETADIIKISEEEISFLTEGEDPFDETVVRKLYHPNLNLLLVTEGPDGCRYYTKEFSGRVKGMKVDAVDTTGAGDAFVAGILSQLAVDLSLIQNEDKLRDALLFANACGASTVTGRGAIPALPTREAVLDVMLKSVA
uniref:probable fructokinase-6, chloroplastic n=1 Tax=Fragaria vesca subsp. vesca TaxID=101020 RepID=UPI0005C8472D